MCTYSEKKLQIRHYVSLCVRVVVHLFYVLMIPILNISTESEWPILRVPYKACSYD